MNQQQKDIAEIVREWSYNVYEEGWEVAMVPVVRVADLADRLADYFAQAYPHKNCNPALTYLCRPHAPFNREAFVAACYKETE